MQAIMKTGKKRPFVLKLILGLLLTPLLFSCGYGELEVVQTIDEEFYDVQKIDIESGFLEVVYEGVEGKTEVTLTGTLESSRPGAYKVNYQMEGDELKIELDQKNLIGSGRHKGVLYISGPVSIELDVESGSGTTQISNVESSEMELDAGSGRLELYNVAANILDLEVGSGTIKGYNLVGNVKGEAGSGRLEFDQIDGDAKLNVSSGVIRVKSITGKLNSQLSSGNLYMERVNEIEELKVSSGSIEGEDIGLGAKTRLSSSSGRIKIQTYSDLAAYNYDFQAGSGRVKVGDSSSSGSLEIHNGSPYTIQGSVSSGSIEIFN